MPFKKNHFILTLVLSCLSVVKAYSQYNGISAILLSRESDYEYRYKPRTREEILINYEDNLVYYRRRSSQKFKLSKLPINNFFKDSVNYDALDDLIVGMSTETENNCSFRNKGSMKLTIIYGDSNHNYSKSFEFGAVISCLDENDFWMLMRIQQEHLNMRNQIF